MQKLVEFIKNNDFSELLQSTQDYYEINGIDYRPQANRLNEVNWSEVDYITIFYGTNDFSSSIPIGTDNDITGDTFKGAINKTIKYLGESIPIARLVFITPMFRSRMVIGDGKNSDDFPNSNGVYLKEYMDAIKVIAEKNHIPYIDLGNVSGINKYTETTYLQDGLHPNNYGYEHIARILQKHLELIY